jgi:hypothetical protein
VPAADSSADNNKDKISHSTNAVFIIESFGPNMSDLQAPTNKLRQGISKKKNYSGIRMGKIGRERLGQKKNRSMGGLGQWTLGSGQWRSLHPTQQLFRWPSAVIATVVAFNAAAGPSAIPLPIQFIRQSQHQQYSPRPGPLCRAAAQPTIFPTIHPSPSVPQPTKPSHNSNSRVNSSTSPISADRGEEKREDA